MAKDTVDVLMVALGGYGHFYLRALLDDPRGKQANIVGAVDPLADRCGRLDELQEMGVPIYDTMDEFYAEHDAELAVISSPIQWHCPQVCKALENGTNVLCEKPLGATIQEAARMAIARDKADRFVAIGYQWSFSTAIQRVKADIMDGRYGAPRRLKTMVLWPRDHAYYNRNSWAARVQDDAGRWVLDSPVNNAVAHFLHNMFYVLGPETDRSAMPAAVQGERYRANDIENYDTAALRARTTDAVEVMFFATHAGSCRIGPVWSAGFDRGRITYDTAVGRVRGILPDGSIVDYGNPEADGTNKLWDALAACRSEKEIVCGPEAASAQTLCMNGLQESMREVVGFPNEVVKVLGEDQGGATRVDGIDEHWIACFNDGLLPSEAGIAWAQAGEEIDLADYDEFPQG
jgi:predicted dehydrogenase